MVNMIPCVHVNLFDERCLVFSKAYVFCYVL